MSRTAFRNEIERMARIIGEEDPVVRNILFAVSRNPWFHDSGVRLLYEHARKKGIDPSRNEPFYKRIEPEDAAGPIEIAREKYHGLIVGLSEKELGESMFIAGRPGTYKTALLEVICPQWVRLGNHIFAISQKMDYLAFAGALPDCCVLDVLQDFRFNPLEPPCPAAANRHAQTVANIMRKNFGSLQSGEASAYKAIDNLYRRFGNYSGQTREYPTLLDLLEYEKARYVTPHTEEAKARERLIKRLDLLCRALNETVNVSRGIPISELMKHNIVLLVDRLNPEVRDFLVECILVSMFTYRIEYGQRV